MRRRRRHRVHTCLQDIIRQWLVAFPSLHSDSNCTDGRLKGTFRDIHQPFLTSFTSVNLLTRLICKKHNDWVWEWEKVCDPAGFPLSSFIASRFNWCIVLLPPWFPEGFPPQFTHSHVCSPTIKHTLVSTPAPRSAQGYELVFPATFISLLFFFYLLLLFLVGSVLFYETVRVLASLCLYSG